MLAALVRSRKPLTRREIAAKAQVDQATLTELIGSNDLARRWENDKGFCFLLLTLKAVAMPKVEEDPTAYEITAAGRKLLSAAKKNG